MGKLDAKVAIVTGGGQGIGRGIALALAREGASISIAELDPARGAAAALEIEKLGAGARALATACDVSVREQVEDTVETTVRELGGVDILINNATWSGSDVGMKSLLEHSEEDFDRHFAVALKGSVHFMQACYPHMAKGGGKIINLASSAGSERIVGFAAYAAAKEAVRALTGVAAREWGDRGINVNVICPWAATPSSKVYFDKHSEVLERALAASPIARLGDPETDIGRAVVFLASSDSDFITGQTLWVDGGNTIHS
jgi:NAD(P)-dependent dehydrogenase (short-subunit alcohol dehydrogenase family)